MWLLPEKMAPLPSGKPLVPRTRWRRGAFYFAMSAFFTFVVNLSFIAWATSNRSHTLDGDIGTIAEEGCPKVKKWNTAIHIVINIISTVLLSGSNYCMQCLIAPTRREVDEAHSKSKWLDIGIPSIRNFGSIAHKRKILWVLLSLSSFPLHLLFNSVVFSSISTNEYVGFTVNKHFLEEEDINALPDFFRSEALDKVYAANKAGDFDRLSLEECINVYGNTFQSSRGTVLLVVSDDVAEDRLANLTSSPLIFSGGGTNAPFDWMCYGDPYYTKLSKIVSCGDLLSEMKGATEDWQPRDVPVQECYSQRTEEHCKLLYSNPLCWVVTLLNLLKGVLMLFVAYGDDDTDTPLLTVGDAVVSFLKEEDPTTENMCLASKTRIKKNHWDKIAVPYEAKPRRKFAAASGIRWVTCISFCILALVVCTSLLVYGLTWALGDTSPSTIAKYGLGEIHIETIMENDSLFGREAANKLLLNAVLANTPQVIMSLIYFNYNALYTSISLVTEWDRFGGETPKGLRVSSTPEGDQRHTYFLQLPYRYSLPLAAFSGGVHWLISQSIFLVNLEVWEYSSDDPNNFQPSNKNVTSCGWSPLGIILVLVAGIVMIVFLLASGWRRLRFGGIPVAASCSAAISAACHPGTYEKDAWKMPLLWGVVAEPETEPRHCSFSSYPVENPVEGQLYA